MQKGSENMNRIFKVIWSKTRNCYVVASELAKGTSKSTSTGRMAKRAVLAAVAALLISPLGAGYSYATIDSATINGTQVITGTQKDAKNLASTVMKATNNANDIGNLKTAMQSVENELAQHQMLIDNLDTDKLTLSSDNTLQKETYDSATKTTTTTDVMGLKVAGPVSAKSASISGTLSAGGAVNAGSVNSRGNITAVGTIAGQTVTATGTMKGKDLIGSNSIISQGTIAATGNISSQATVGAKEMVSQTNITAKNKVVGMQGVVDNTLTSGNYVTAGNTVGKNIVTLDTQVKANADAIAEKANAIHDEIKAGDEKLDTRITNVKEYLEKQTSDTYVSKDDAAVQDGAIVKADKTIGENVTNLDAALAKETADRLGADKAQDKVIQQVNQNMVDGFNTINKNMADGFTALNNADLKEAQERAAADTALDDKITAETSARVAADTKLVEAVNSGLSLSNDNVLKKNTTAINAQGNVTTSKTDANEMILNKDKANQITLNENGIKVGTNSTVVDKDGVYTGGDTYAAAKAAMSADGKIKGANGAFTVDENGNVASKATITGETVTDGKGASMSNGTVTGKTLTDGIATITNGNINTSGTITGGTVTSTGNISALGDIHAGGAITGASASIQGALTAGSATITGDLTAGGAIQGKSLSDGTATMQNGNLTGVKNLSAETITTSGDATIGGDLTVNGKLNVDEIDLTKSGIVGDNNVTASTKVAAGKITSYKKATSTKDGSEKEAAFDYDENGTSTWAKATDADGNWKKSTLTVEGSDVTSKVVDSDKNSNESKQTSTESSDVVKDADGNTSTFSQRVKDILQEIKNASGDTLTKVEQTDTAITSQIGDGSAVKSEMTADGITNTAVGGTITNSAKDLVNTATGDMTNTVGGKMLNDVTGDMENKVGGNLTTTVGGNQTTTVTGDSSLTAENITNEAKNKITNKALDVETDASSSIVSKVSNEYGSNTSTQLSYQTTEEMSQADGKTASYLRGAAEEKSQLIDGSKKTTIDTIAGQTNTNITDGTNTSNDLQKADQVASSVTDGTNTTVVNQDAKSLASSITDGTKANNSSNTVDKSEQLIKASDTQYSATSKTATKMEDALVSGGSVIDVIKNLDDAANPFIGSAVTDGTNSTGVTQTAKDITNTAKNGTIANEAKDITNNATENMTNTVGKDLTTTVGGEMKTTVTGDVKEDYKANLSTTVGGNQTTTVTVDSSLSAKNITNTATEKLSNSATDIENKASTSILNQVRDNTSWKMTDGQVVESIKGADGQTNTTTTTADDTYQSVQKGNNVLAKRTSSTNDNLNITDGTNTYSKITTATSNKQTVTDGTETASTNLTKSASNTYITNGTQTVTNHIAADTTNTVMNEGSNGSRQEQTASQILDRVTNGTNTNSTTTTASGTTFENTAHNTALAEMTKHESGDFTKTTISGNTIETGQATMDYAEVMKDLGVHGNATVDGNTSVGGNLSVTGTSTLTGDVTMKSNATVENNLTVKGTTTTKKLVVNNGATVTGGTTTDTLHVTSSSTFDGAATFKDVVIMEKDLSVGGNATVAGSMTASSYKVGDKTYISESGINANNQKVVNVATGDLSANSTDAVNGAQLYQTNERVTGVENKVNKLDSRVDKVGANAAALANLHPLEFDADSKWNIAAAVGGYKGETATAIGAFYRPNENVMVNVSSSFGTGENMYGGGISLCIGQGGNKARRNATNGLTEREKAMQKQIDSLTSRLDALLSVINPNMSKDFPDVPENHWAYEAVSRLAGNGVIQGYEDGKYHGDRTMTRYEMAEIIYNALSKGAKAEKKLVEEFKPELQAMAAQKKA